MKHLEMKSDLPVLIQYLEHAAAFERLAMEEANADLKKAFLGQAHSYRATAAEYAEKLGLPAPSLSAHPDDRG